MSLCPRGRNQKHAEAIWYPWVPSHRLYESACLLFEQPGNPLKPDDHSKVVPLLPIPNRTVKRLSADDSADARVKVGHRQATQPFALIPLGMGAFGL
jgi:hypothetical protein